MTDRNGCKYLVLRAKAKSYKPLFIPINFVGWMQSLFFDRKPTLMVTYGPSLVVMRKHQKDTYYKKN